MIIEEGHGAEIAAKSWSHLSYRHVIHVGQASNINPTLDSWDSNTSRIGKNSERYRERSTEAIAETPMVNSKSAKRESALEFAEICAQARARD